MNNKKLIDEIYEYTGLIFSEHRAKHFQRLIDKKIEEAMQPKQLSEYSKETSKDNK